MKIKKGGNVTNKHQKRNPKPEKRFQHSNPKFLTEPRLNKKT